MESWLEPHIQTVEDELGVEVVAVWETGSVAYNFAHTESDTDLTVLYVQPRNAYIFDREYRQGFTDETAGIHLDGDVEIEGWDIQRFRELLLDYDPMVYETLQSPLGYEVPQSLQELADYAVEHIHPIQLFTSYQSSAEGVFKSQREKPGAITNKYMFHTVRNVLMARYILVEHEFPPLDFELFLEEASSEIFVEYSESVVRELYRAKCDTQQSEEVIEPINYDALQSFFDYELTYEDHIPESTMQVEIVDDLLRGSLE